MGNTVTTQWRGMAAAHEIPVVGLVTGNGDLRRAIPEVLSPWAAVVHLPPAGGHPDPGAPIQALIVDADLVAGGVPPWLEHRARPVLVVVHRERLEAVRPLRRDGWDFVVWPCLEEELRVRLHVLLQAAGRGKDPIVCGPIVVDRERWEVTVAGRPVHLTPKEYRVLEELALHRGRPLSRHQLLLAAWGWESDTGSNVVDAVVRNLRKKLEPVPARPRYIVTVRGVGYKLVCGGPQGGV